MGDKRRFHKYNPVRYDQDPERVYAPIQEGDPTWDDCCPCEPNTPKERQEAIEHPCVDIGPNPMTSRFILTLAGFSGAPECEGLNGSFLLLPATLDPGLLSIAHTDFGPCRETPTDDRAFAYGMATSHLGDGQSDGNYSSRGGLSLSVAPGAAGAEFKCRLTGFLEAGQIFAVRVAGQDWDIQIASAGGKLCNAGTLSFSRLDGYCKYALPIGPDPENAAWDVQVETGTWPFINPPTHPGCTYFNGGTWRMSFLGSSIEQATRQLTYVYRYTDASQASLELRINGDLLLRRPSHLFFRPPHLVLDTSHWSIWGEGDYAFIASGNDQGRYCNNPRIISLTRVDGV